MKGLVRHDDPTLSSCPSCYERSGSLCGTQILKRRGRRERNGEEAGFGLTFTTVGKQGHFFPLPSLRFKTRQHQWLGKDLVAAPPPLVVWGFTFFCPKK